MENLKLPGKLALLACITLFSVALTFTYAGVTAINRLAVSQSQSVMSSEIRALHDKLIETHDQRAASGIGDAKALLQKTQAEFLAGLKNYRFGKNGRLYIVADDGNVVFVGEGRNVSDFKTEDLKRFLAQPSGVVEAEVGGSPSLVALGGFKPWSWRLVLVVPDRDINSPRDEFLDKVAVIVALCMVMCVPIFVYVGTGFVRPIRLLSQRVSSITLDNLGERIKIGDTDPEVEELHQSLELMTKRLHAAISEKKQAG